MEAKFTQKKRVLQDRQQKLQEQWNKMQSSAWDEGLIAYVLLSSDSWECSCSCGKIQVPGVTEAFSLWSDRHDALDEAPPAILLCLLFSVCIAWIFVWNALCVCIVYSFKGVIHFWDCNVCQNLIDGSVWSTRGWVCIHYAQTNMYLSVFHKRCRFSLIMKSEKLGRVQCLCIWRKGFGAQPQRFFMSLSV